MALQVSDLTEKILHFDKIIVFKSLVQPNRNFHFTVLSDMDTSSDEENTSDVITRLSKAANIVSSQTAFIGVDEDHVVVEDIMTVDAEDLMGEDKDELDEAMDFQYFGAAPQMMSAKMHFDDFGGKLCVTPIICIHFV